MATYPMVGITGGVGCGKSEVGRILAGFGVKVVDADDVVHELLQTDADLKRARFRSASVCNSSCTTSSASTTFTPKPARMRPTSLLPHPTPPVMPTIG